MVESQGRKIERGDKDLQETCFALAKVFSACAEEVNPLFDFSNRRSRLKHRALIARAKGLINQNPRPEDLKRVIQENKGKEVNTPGMIG